MRVLSVFFIGVLFSVSCFSTVKDKTDNCVQFATFYAINTVTSNMILKEVGGSDQGAVYDYNFFPDTPELKSSILRNDGDYVKTYSSVITVVSKAEPVTATRYYVTLKLIDHDTSCSMVADSPSIELEN